MVSNSLRVESTWPSIIHGLVNEHGGKPHMVRKARVVVGGEAVSRNAGVKLRWSHPSGSEHCSPLHYNTPGSRGEERRPGAGAGEAWLPTCVARG